MLTKERVVIIGSGPAGLSAAIYVARANLSPIVITGSQMGGQLTTTNEVENYPGISDISGTNLVMKMMEQAERFGTKFIYDQATQITYQHKDIIIHTKSQQIICNSLIIATGATAKWLELKNEHSFKNNGLSACAICDGPLPYFKNKHIVVVGGGDSACEEALFLTKFTDNVTIIHRRDKLRASKILQERVQQNSSIKFIWNSEITEYLGNFPDNLQLDGIKILNNKTMELSSIKCQGVFMAIGHKPSTNIFKNIIDLDSDGYIIVKNNVHTNLPNVFVAGDVSDKIYKQAITAAGFGCMAALACIHYIEENYTS